MPGVADINVGTDWDAATLSADSSINDLGNFQNDQVAIIDDDMSTDPGFTEFGSGAGSFSYDAINEDYDIDSRRNTTPHGIYLALGAAYVLTDNYRMEFKFVPSTLDVDALSVFGLFNSGNRNRSNFFYTNMIALGIASGGGLIFYAQNSSDILYQVLGLGITVIVGRTYKIIIENTVINKTLSLTIYENGIFLKKANMSSVSDIIGTITVNEFRVCNGGSSTSNAIIAGDLDNLLFSSDFSTAAKVIETDIIGLAESFDSGDIRFKTDRVIAAGTEVKAYVKLDGGAYGAAINVNTTPVAGMTGVYQFTAGTAFTPVVNVVIKLEINSPDVDTQIQVTNPWIDDITVLKYSVDTDPGDSIRQQIIDVLTTRFATILISNGYKTNMGNNVTHWRASRSDVSQAKLPHLGWEDADEDEIDETIGQVDHSLTITCKISAQSIDDVYEARADLIKLIGTDVFMSGLAGNTTPPVEQGSGVQGEEKTWGQEYKFIIEYPTDRFDEYTQ